MGENELYRYCRNCNEEFDFDIKSINDLDKLICPKCGGAIDKDSRKPRSAEAIARQDQMEESIGNTIYWFMYITMYIYAAFAIVGIVMYFIGADIWLYVWTAASVIAYLLRYGNSEYGIAIMGVGAALGFYFIRSPQGACLGVLIILIILALVRKLILRLMMKFIQFSKKQK